MILDQDVARSRDWAPTAPEGWHTAVANHYLAGQYKEGSATAHQTKLPMRATVMVPIYNEKKALPSFLRALLVSDIPTISPVQFLFITNACTDQSSVMVRDFLSSIDPRADTVLAPQVSTDPLLDHESFLASKNGVTFRHLDTATPGKANALRLGNEVALQSGHQVALSVDANVYPAPDALHTIYEQAKEQIFEHSEDGVKLLYGQPRRIHRPTLYSELVLKHMKQAPPNAEVLDLKGVNGWMMGWSTEWFDGIHDRVQVAVEDYAMGAVARSQGFHTLKIPEAEIWGYKGSTLRDDFRERVRSIRGMMQIAEQSPELIPQMEKDNRYMRRFGLRARDLVKRSKGSIFRAPLQVANFLLFELAHIQAAHEFKEDPTNQSWPEIVSSK